MNDRLSILDTNPDSQIETNRSDVMAAFLKSIVGVAPFVGPLLTEAIGFGIPNQKLDRIITFARLLDDKVKYLEVEVVLQKTKTSEFTDLLEDGLVQASRAMTNERREFIASLLKNSITNVNLAHIEEKKLLALLGELNDAEILILSFHTLVLGERENFAKRHNELFDPIDRHLEVPQTNVDKGALRDSYKRKLIEVGLLEPVFKRTEKGKLPEFDEKTGQINATSFRATTLGKLLLRYIESDF